MPRKTSHFRAFATGPVVALFTIVFGSARRVAIEIALLTTVILAAQSSSGASSVAVRHREGVLHGFLELRAVNGARLAAGDLIQTVAGDRVTSRLTFRFADGSLSDETTVFTEHGHFKLVSDHLIQRGPSFPVPLDLSIDAGAGTISVAYSDTHGQQHTIHKRMEVPDDLANGLVLTLLKNIDPRARTATDVSMIAATPQPRLVRLTLTPGSTDRFTIAGSSRTAHSFIVHVDLGGVTGVFARLFGKQPPDSRVWILEGDAPAFVKSEQPFYAGGPLWRIELVSPKWSSGEPGSRAPRELSQVPFGTAPPSPRRSPAP